jgi:hypothetical protein
MRIIGYILGLIWCLPNLVVGLLLALWYRPTKVRWYKGCLEFIAGRKKDKHGNDRTRIWGKPGGQSLGCPVVCYATVADWENARLRRHERTHTIQGLVLGIFFGPLYGGHWLLIRVFDCPDEPASEPAWKRAYLAICFEKQARRRELEAENWGT